MLTTWPVGHVEAGLFETLTRQLSQHMWVSKVATCLGWTPACALRTDNVALRDSPMAANVSGGKRCPDFKNNKKLRSYGPGQRCWIGCFQRSCKLVRLNMDAPLVTFVNCRNTSAHAVNHRKFSCVETQHCTFRTCAAIHAGLESCKGHEADNGLNDGCLPK